MEAAADYVDEVLCVVPRVFPHKLFHGATLDERLQMLNAIRLERVPYSLGVAEKGLFIEIARECREAYGPEPELVFLCGRDAAERIVEWDYAEPDTAERMFDEFSLLVARRKGAYEVPNHLEHCIGTLDLEPDLTMMSATEVRELIRLGQPWEHLVPPEIVPMVNRIYR